MSQDSLTVLPDIDVVAEISIFIRWSVQHDRVIVVARLVVYESNCSVFTRHHTEHQASATAKSYRVEAHALKTLTFLLSMSLKRVQQNQEWSRWPQTRHGVQGSNSGGVDEIAVLGKLLTNHAI